MKKFGLFIGVDRYRYLYAPAQHLACAGADARALHAFFQQQPGFETALLEDQHLGWQEQGSHEAIFEQLAQWQQGLVATDQHLLLIYFAGHGSYFQGGHFLLAPKAPDHALSEPVQGDMGVISEDLLKRVSARWPNTRRVFIFDTCRVHADAAQLNPPAPIASRVALGVVQQAHESGPALEPNLLILRACAAQQMAFELREYGEERKNHGLFTAAMLEVMHHHLEAGQRLEFNPHFQLRVQQQMQQLATQYAPPAARPAALAQQSVLQGDPVCLLSEQEVNAHHQRRIVQEFERHLSAGHFHQPTLQCCAESLRRLQALKYPPSDLLQLGQRLDEAVNMQQAVARRAKGEKLLALARRTKSAEAYLKLLEQEFYEYEAEVEAFFAAREAEDKTLREAAARAEILAAQLEQAKQQIDVLSTEKKASATQFQQQIARLKAELAGLQAAQTESGKEQVRLAEHVVFEDGVIEGITAHLVAKDKPGAPAPALSSKYKPGDVFQDRLADGNPGPQMVVLPAGSFQLGSEERAEERFGPQVRIARPFAMGRYPVTVEEYLAAVEAKACRPPQWLEPGGEYNYANGKNDHYRKLGNALHGKRFPVVGVSWDDALAYVAWLNRAISNGPYRLPSEVEWEYAARAGGVGRWCFGDEEKKLQDFAWYDKNSDGSTHEVGGKQANRFGLYDMHGNVWEWVADHYHENYLGAPKDGSVWQESGEKGKYRVLRFRSWFSYAAIWRSAFRSSNWPGYRNVDVGFRVARTLP